MYKKKRSFVTKRKALFGILVGVISFALLLGGALAWTDFTQSKTNRFRGTIDPDVTLHDEFAGENKDVFVENSGKNDIYVRVRLDEYMEIGGVPFDSTADVKDKSTWKPHTYGTTPADINDCGNVDGSELFHDYYTWSMTGAQRNFNPGTPGMVYTRLGANGEVSTAGPNETAKPNAPITMAEYHRIMDQAYDDMTTDDQEIFEVIKNEGCWILDTDGWCYWSKVLRAEHEDEHGTKVQGEATNLLLDGVKFKNEPADDWFYGIDVKLQAVTANDFGKWSSDGGITTGTHGAEQMIEYLKLWAKQ